MTESIRFRPSSVLFSLLVLSPLFWIPNYGDDAVRLPAVLAGTTVLLVLQALRAMRSRRRPAPLLWAALILMAANLLSLAAARSAGEAVVPLLVLFAGVAAFAVVRSGTVDREFLIEGAPVLLSIVGLALSTIGFVQALRELPVVSTQGNPNYSGALAGMLLPATVAFAFGGGGPVRRLLPGLSAAGLLALLLLTKSRGGWAGAVAGMAVVAASLAGKRLPGARIALVGGIALLALPFAFRGAAQVSESGSGSVTFRLEAWKGALRMVAARPVLGFGVGSFSLEYPPYRTEAEFRASHQFAGRAFKEVEDAHSVWVQTAVETGILGLLSMLLVVYVAARLWRYYVKVAEEPEEIALLAGVGGGAAAFLVAGAFNTLTTHVTHSLLFWIFLGILERVGNAAERRSFGTSGQGAVALPLAAAIAGAFATWVAGTLAVADREFTLGMSTRDHETAARHFERAAEGHPAPWRIQHELASAYWSMNRLPEALATERDVVRRRPHFVDALDRLAVMLLGGKNEEEEAERILKRAIEIAPYYHLSHYNLGSLFLRRKKLAAARAEFLEAVRCNDRHASSEFSLGETIALDGDAASALPHFRRARDLGVNVGQVLRQERPELATNPAYAEFFR